VPISDAIIVGVANTTVSSNKEKNLNLLRSLLDDAASRDVRFLVLPEVFLQGYADFSLVPGSAAGAAQKRHLVAAAETIPGPTTDWLAKFCREHQMVVQVGMIERDRLGDHLYNSIALVGPSGLVGRYRKTHNRLEAPYFRAGKSLSVFDLPFGRAGSIICADILYPEVPRALTLRGAKIIALSTAWPAVAADASDYGWAMDLMVASTAFSNHVWVLASNQNTQGASWGDVNYYGNSQIVGPDGCVIGRIGNEEGILTSEVCIEEGVAASKTERFYGLNMLDERRPELYTDIALEDVAPEV
jgi:predicted amidohydrolase